MAPGLFAALAVMLLALLGIGTRFYISGDFNAIHGLLSLFFLDQPGGVLLGSVSFPQTGLYRDAYRVMAHSETRNRPDAGC